LIAYRSRWFRHLPGDLRGSAFGFIGDDFQQLLKTSASQLERRCRTRQDRRGLGWRPQSAARTMVAAFDEAL